MASPVKDIAKKMFEICFKDSYAASFEKMFKYKTIRPGTLVGTDQFGNKYYQAPPGSMELRDRWVEYGGKKKDFNASRIPPEWHTWMTNVDEQHLATQIPFEQQPFMLKYRPNELSKMAQNANYLPSNYYCKPVDVNPIKYDKQKYTSWDPTRKTDAL